MDDKKGSVIMEHCKEAIEAGIPAPIIPPPLDEICTGGPVEIKPYRLLYLDAKPKTNELKAVLEGEWG